MRERLYISGEGSPELEKETQDLVDASREHGTDLFPHELEKTADQVWFLEKIEEYFNEELRALEIQEPVKVDPNRYHFLPRGSFLRHFPEARNSLAVYQQRLFGIFIGAGATTRSPELFHAVFHESTHAVSYQSIIAHLKQGKGILSEYRGGYSFRDSDNPERFEFVGLNEAVTEKTTIELLTRHIEELRARLNFSSEDAKELQEENPVYKKYIDLVNILISAIAQHRGQNPETVWQRFKKGMFTGNMMHLRDVDRIFGNGSLRLLSSVGFVQGEHEGQEESSQHVEMTEQVVHYFKTDDPVERQKILERLKEQT